ncbi:Vitamin H transporter 1 [Wickerhamomyces ciferrii]|uniref:Vitamin H transporter 1 n=1 Tax=Wickerhamomyces ciferrii (strain ATCC 14091 / BCRC 22168 / CBS 111 / JCM 3599 / NBRC 0793 / NRRL Y-1031 F-60-10) TaxID=1206466 RepID=K0KLF7_WICCF|nr:Vitamin H transporter 1 [Wickerhamomyces ciferrii]CCH41953.1 Vitamin H transporter 1 [Wickerhamomyces ciferrii]
MTDINSSISSKNEENPKNLVQTQEQEEENYLPEFTPEELQRLNKIYWKLDLRIIPALWLLYFLTSFGSSAYGNTLTMNSESHHSLSQTLKLTTHDTSTASALYYVGYIIFDVPMNMIMTRLAPQAWLSRIVFTVGLVYACYASLSNSGGIIAVRFISGIAGAGTWPGLSYYVSLWYPPHRITRRIGYYFTAAQLSAAAAGLVAAGFQKMDMIHGLEGWRWLFLVYGVITIFVSLLLLVWLPDNDLSRYEATSKFGIINRLKKLNVFPLTPEEHELHQREMSHYNKKINWGLKDVWNIFKDINVWPLIMMYFGVVGTGFGLAVFGTTLIKAVLGVSSINVSLLYAPIWLFDLGAILLITPFSDIFKKFKPLIFSLATLIIIIGLVVCNYAQGKWSRYGGLLISGFGLGPTVPTCMSMTSEIFGSKYGDIGIAVSSALVSGLGNLGSVMATYALYSGWPEDKARTFEYSNMMLVVILGVSIISAGISTILTRRNKQI